MGQKLKIDDSEYDIDDLSEQASATLASLRFADARMLELNNMLSLLRRAKNSYIQSLKKEMLSSKAGLVIEDD